MKVSIWVFLLIILVPNIGCKKKGCTYITATNYDPEAEKDDGTCIFPDHITPLMIQNKLIGTWLGDGTATFGGGIEWKATFVIEADGHYTGQVTSVQTGSIYSVFDNGDDNLDDPEKKFTIETIDAFGKASGKVTFVHSQGSLMEYQIKDLVFSNNDNNVDFTVDWGAQINYSLTK